MEDLLSLVISSQAEAGFRRKLVPRVNSTTAAPNGRMDLLRHTMKVMVNGVVM